MTGDQPRTESEMTAKFSQLKMAGTGTLFASAAPGSEQAGSGGALNAKALTIDLAPGAIIGGLYEIIRLIGQGGMGEVYLARHMTLNKNCALKVIPPDQVTEVTWLRFQLEAKTVAQLNHINIVRVTDLGIHEDCLPFYAMEYLEGSNLAELLEANGPMPLDRALETFIQVCDGVECAHRAGILHRDLKPANIMLMKSNKGKLEVKVLDFGLAKLTRHDRNKQSLTAVGDVFGSPSYMSPEQCGSEQLDNRSDIYSIGCTLFECLTNRPPYVGNEAAAVFFGHLTGVTPTLASVVGEDVFSPQMERIINRLLRKKRDERYQSLAELKQDLEAVAKSRAKTPDRSDSKSSGRRPVKSSGGQVRKPASPVAVSGGGSNKKGHDASPWGVPLLTGTIVTCLALCYFFLGPPRGDLSAIATKSGAAVPGSVTGETSGPAQGLANQTEAQNSPEAPQSLASLRPRSEDDSTFIANGNKLGEAGAPTWDGKPFYQGPVVKDGKSYQHWRCYGTVSPPCYLEFDGPKELERLPLVGDIFIPSSRRVTLWPRRSILAQSGLIKGLTGAVCDQVDFRWFTLGEIAVVAPTLAASPSIKALSVGNINWRPEDSRASAAVINLFPNLDRLILGAPYDGLTLLKLQRLKELSELRINFTGVCVKECLEAICSSSQLKSLYIADWRLPLAELKLVAQCTSIEKLMIGRLRGTTEQLAELSNMPCLQKLDLPNLAYRHDLAADLARFKTLKALKFQPSGDWKIEQIIKLRKALPAVYVDLYENDTQQWQSLSHP